MKTIKLFILLMILGLNLHAQSDFDITINSKILETDRKIKIHLPKSYENSQDKTYPLILVLDSEITFYFTVGNTEIMYDQDPDFEQIPETIVVGIYQNYYLDNTAFNQVRGKDSKWNPKTGGFSKSSKLFNDFITEELLPYLKSNYRIGQFNAILGHSLTASFISSMLIENDNSFDAYILLSPNLNDFDETLFNNIEKMNQSKFIYLCTSSNDLIGHKTQISKLHNQYFSKFSYKNMYYQFDDFNEADHMSLLNRSIPYALQHIFTYYNFTKSQTLIKQFLLDDDKNRSYSNFLMDAKNIYGVENNIRSDDFFEVYWPIDNSKDWKQYKAVSDILFDKFPKTIHPFFARAMYEEKYNKDYKKALEYYKSGLEYLTNSFFDEASYKEDIKRVSELIKE